MTNTTLWSIASLTIRDRLDSGYQDGGTCVQRMDTLMENCFDFLDENIEIVQAILKNNPPNLYLINQIRFYLLSNMSAAFQDNSGFPSLQGAAEKWLQTLQAR